VPLGATHRRAATHVIAFTSHALPHAMHCTAVPHVDARTVRRRNAPHRTASGAKEP